jgi:hypothetical protein
MFGIITVKGNASGSRKARRWKVREAVNAKAAWNAIMFASATGSVGAKDVRDETLCGGTVRVIADVVELNEDGSERQPG